MHLMSSDDQDQQTQRHRHADTPDALSHTPLIDTHQEAIRLHCDRQSQEARERGGSNDQVDRQSEDEQPSKQRKHKKARKFRTNIPFTRSCIFLTDTSTRQDCRQFRLSCLLRSFSDKLKQSIFDDDNPRQAPWPFN